MKRSKIKPKYLQKISTISIQKQSKSNNSKTNFSDKIEHIIIKTLISLGLILLLLLWNYIFIAALTILGLHFNTVNDTFKIVINFISNLAFLSLLFIFYRKTIQKDFQNYFLNNFKDNFKTSLKYWGIGLLIMMISNYIIAIITSGQLAENEEAVRDLIQLAPLYMAFDLMIYAPITEELIFRKSIKDITSNKYIYVLLSGLIFGGLHVISSLETAIDLLYLIPYCSLGFAFALLYSKTDNIFSTITVHSLHNTLALLLYLSTL